MATPVASTALTALATDADLLIVETSLAEDRQQAMMADGRWQAMTPTERAGKMRPATQGHMTLEAIGKTAAEARVKTVSLSHLTQRFGSDDYTPWADEVKRHFSGEVVIAQDLMEF